jgi:hypothetical protein
MSDTAAADSSYVQELEAKLAACQRAGRAALVAARAQIMDLQKQLADSASGGQPVMQAITNQPEPNHHTQDLRKTIQHLQLDLEVQLQKRHGIDEERIRQDHSIDYYK